MVAILLLGPILTAAADRENLFAFALAVLRRDGTLFPFAVYDGKHFKNPWPEPEKHVNAPITLRDISKGWWFDHQPILEWTLFPLDGSASRTLNVTGPTWFPAYCQQSIGLRTDYQPTILPPPPRMQPYPKDGVAISGHTTISPITVVKDPKDKTVVALMAQLPKAMASKETTLSRQFLREGWQNSYSEEERRKQPVSLEALYRVPHNLEGKDVYYYEAVKRYFYPKPGLEKTGEESKCDYVTFASGWFTTDENGTLDHPDRLTPHVHVTSCDYAHVGFMLPLGTITIERKRLWIGQWSNWTGEIYSIVDPSALASGAEDATIEEVFKAPGGQCEGTN
jgi:hypothetical protein